VLYGRVEAVLTLRGSPPFGVEQPPARRDRPIGDRAKLGTHRRSGSASTFPDDAKGPEEQDLKLSEIEEHGGVVEGPMCEWFFASLQKFSDSVTPFIDR
jgi:hypothetical protein